MDSSTIKDYIGAVTQSLEPLAAKIGQGGTWMFAQALRNNYAIAVQEIGYLVLALIAWVCMVKLYYPWVRTQPRDEYNNDASDWAVALSLFLSVLTIVALTVVLHGALPRLIAPEWNTLTDIISAFRPATR